MDGDNGTHLRIGARVMPRRTALNMTMDDLLELPVSFGLKTAAAALNIAQTKIYEYAPTGCIPGDPPIPVHKYGTQYRVSRADVFRRLGLDPAMVRAPEADTKGAA